MEFSAENRTWIFSGFDNLITIGFDADNNPVVINKSFLEIDYLDGSFHDSDGDEKKLLIKFENNSISFETLPEDYDFWKGTENCFKKGCLGYLAELLIDLKDCPNFECEIVIKEDVNYKESFLWDVRYVKEEYSEIFCGSKIADVVINGTGGNFKNKI